MPDYAAGWYPDYAQPGQQRYHDGLHWTDYVFSPEAAADGSRRGRRRHPRFRASAQLVEATYRMLFADRAMIALLFVGAVLGAAAAGTILFPAIYWGHVTPNWSNGGVLGVLVACSAFGTESFVMQLVCGAVVAAAILRAEDRPATVKQALSVAWGRRRQIFAWALVSTLVGAVIRSLERLGLGGLLAALTLNLGWAVATVFATPVIIVEGTMPMATVRRSAGLLRRTFTVTLVSNVRLTFVWSVFAAVAMAVGGVGVLLCAFGGNAAAVATGILLIAGGGVGLVFVIAISSALSAYLQAVLYRHAIGMPVPDVDRRWLPPLRPS